MSITGIFQTQSVLKQFRFCVKLILNQTVCLDVKTGKDFEEFLKLLNKHSVRYRIIGSHALAFHTRPRYTKDE